jgi:hypothetical protein
MGEKALDRSELLLAAYPPTTTAALTETSKRTGVGAGDLFFKTVVKINPAKYRSPRRKDQLQAVARLLFAAAFLFTDHTNDSLLRWNFFLLPAFYVTVWRFPTAYSQTPMQRAPPQ